ncbi:protein spire homolog 2 isoform X1 [Corythoichthys intestinalis]|uniref:protein spire homolog 2 isoform X1 n=2 Tax=Corythoichthys intestinalis TaxID=161448 RepID=UPI0025A641F2|nr:protein spire homolog 2 isoform X1 [Corythoichthys intestinalis]
MATRTNIRDRDQESRVTVSTDPEEPRELSLEAVLKSYEQPINEEQAWALCYQCCRGLTVPVPLPPTGKSARARVKDKDPSSILLHRDGTVSLLRDTPLSEYADWPPAPSNTEQRLIQSLGVAIYRALDWGLDDTEERDLSPQLEHLIECMTGGDQGDEMDNTPAITTREDYGGHKKEETALDGAIWQVPTFCQVMAQCTSRLANSSLAPEHYKAVCRALFVESLELQMFLLKIREAQEMLKRLTKEESLQERSAAELDTFKRRDWARLWVQLMKELRQGVKLKNPQEHPFNPPPTEFSLTPFEILMEDIRARNFKLRKVMVDGVTPSRRKRNAHELILDIIRSRPPLKPVAERSLLPPPPQQQSLHERVLAEIKQERKLRPIVPATSKAFGSLPCLAQACPCKVKSSSCINLSELEPGCGFRVPSRFRILLKAPTLDEMEEMNTSEEDESPDNTDLWREESVPTPMKRDRSFSEDDLALLRGESLPCFSESVQLDNVAKLSGEGLPPNHRASVPLLGWVSPHQTHLALSEAREDREKPFNLMTDDEHQWMCVQEEFSHPVDSLALTVDEVINVRRVLVKAEMEKFLQSKELYNNLKKGKVCCCCRVKFPIFSWPSSCLLCKRSVCNACSAKMKLPCKKMAYIPVYTVGFHMTPKNHEHKSKVYKSLCNLSCRRVEEEFPHLYANGCTLHDICAECSKFVADVISSSRRSLDIINNTPKKEVKAISQRVQIPPMTFEPHEDKRYGT